MEKSINFHVVREPTGEYIVSQNGEQVARAGSLKTLKHLICDIFDRTLD